MATRRVETWRRLMSRTRFLSLLIQILYAGSENVTEVRASVLRETALGQQSTRSRTNTRSHAQKPPPALSLIRFSSRVRRSARRSRNERPGHGRATQRKGGHGRTVETGSGVLSSGVNRVEENNEKQRSRVDKSIDENKVDDGEKSRVDLDKDAPDGEKRYEDLDQRKSLQLATGNPVEAAVEAADEQNKTEEREPPRGAVTTLDRKQEGQGQEHQLPQNFSEQHLLSEQVRSPGAKGLSENYQGLSENYQGLSENQRAEKHALQDNLEALTLDFRDTADIIRGSLAEMRSSVDYIREQVSAGGDPGVGTTTTSASAPLSSYCEEVAGNVTSVSKQMEEQFSSWADAASDAVSEAQKFIRSRVPDAVAVEELQAGKKDDASSATLGHDYEVNLHQESGAERASRSLRRRSKKALTALSRIASAASGLKTLVSPLATKGFRRGLSEASVVGASISSRTSLLASKFDEFTSGLENAMSAVLLLKAEDDDDEEASFFL
ncbi:unnamed protein product [Amoebophrya sp. A25]|nr:unnamed protein product [Amoebophrya sp. A25]|eukprot:GSA25T00003614001.1